ncbi:MAG: hypothetical protein MJZ25_12815 [Fibrobacter sp.]|nr:hypothetical protein [Fibrobacter sp.]
MTKEELEQVYDCLDGGFGETSGKLSAHIKALEAEIERLKQKIAAFEDERKCLSETITCDANVIYNLNKENAKLKCLALHSLHKLFWEKQNTAFRDGKCALSWDDKVKCDKRGGKYLYWREKYLELYRKAKAEM